MNEIENDDEEEEIEKKGEKECPKSYNFLIFAAYYNSVVSFFLHL